MPDTTNQSAAGAPDDLVIDLLVVGGGPAGLAAARAYRENWGAGRVLILSADEHPPYNRPPLTKDYLRGEIGPDELSLVPDAWYTHQQVGLRLGVTVVDLDRADRVVWWVPSTEPDATPAAIGYRRLVLATGSRPLPLPVPGGDHPDLILVRDRHSADAMRAVSGPGHRVLVVGSGFVGCEAAASLSRTGADVVLLTDESVPHASRLGPDAGRHIERWLRDDGVDVRTGNGVASIERRAADWSVVLEDGSEIVGDAVVCGSGAAPEIGLAERSGLDLLDGGIRTDAGLRTADPAVWAVGDIACATNAAARRNLRVEHWGEAETMGEIAGATAAGRHGRWAQAPGFWSEIGDHTLKYCSWGDGFDVAELTGQPGGDGWAVWYVRDQILVGVLTSEWDDAYEQGQSLIEAHAAVTAVGSLTGGLAARGSVAGAGQPHEDSA